MLKHEGNVYMLTDRFTRPFRNIATYVKAWMDTEAAEDLDVEFPNARKGVQEDAGGQGEEAPKAEEAKKRR